jgi:hypothetical protein
MAEITIELTTGKKLTADTATVGDSGRVLRLTGAKTGAVGMHLVDEIFAGDSR